MVEDGDDAGRQRPAEGGGPGRGRPALAAVADDTGLEVDALGGAPGVYSARYAGEDATYADNVAKLLRELAAAAPTAAARGGPGSAPWPWWPSPTAPRSGPRVPCEGTIADGARGARRVRVRPGVRAADGDGRTFAEMSAAEKHALSHRGRAFRSLAAKLARRAE